LKPTALLAALLLPSAAFAADPLPSWNDGQAETAIMEFVEATVDPSSAAHVLSNRECGLKTRLRKAAARTVNALGSAIAGAIQAFTPQECANYFTATGYEPE
jgi:hypothetical protein